MRTAKFIDIIKSFGGYLRVDNKAGYKEDYTLDDLGDNDFPTKLMLVSYVPTPDPIVYNLPAGSETPIVINFPASTIKIGAASAVAIGSLLPGYSANPDVKFKQVIDTENTKPIGNEGWITNEEWADDTYTSLVELTIVPDNIEDPENPGSYITLDNINIIIKA